MAAVGGGGRVGGRVEPDGDDRPRQRRQHDVRVGRQRDAAHVFGQDGVDAGGGAVGADGEDGFAGDVDVDDAPRARVVRGALPQHGATRVQYGGGGRGGGHRWRSQHTGKTGLVTQRVFVVH